MVSIEWDNEWYSISVSAKKIAKQWRSMNFQSEKNYQSPECQLHTLLVQIPGNHEGQPSGLILIHMWKLHATHRIRPHGLAISRIHLPEKTVRSSPLTTRFKLKDMSKEACWIPLRNLLPWRFKFKFVDSPPCTLSMLCKWDSILTILQPTKIFQIGNGGVYTTQKSGWPAALTPP